MITWIQKLRSTLINSLIGDLQQANTPFQNVLTVHHDLAMPASLSVNFGQRSQEKEGHEGCDLFGDWDSNPMTH